MLSAEKSAAQKVSEARKRKNRRLKQAKEEAQQEIEKFKGERERQFREHEAKNAGSKGETMGAILLCLRKYDYIRIYFRYGYLPLIICVDKSVCYYL